MKSSVDKIYGAGTFLEVVNKDIVAWLVKNEIENGKKTKLNNEVGGELDSYTRRKKPQPRSTSEVVSNGKKNFLAI